MPDDYQYRLVFGFTAFITCGIVVLLTGLWMQWVENRSLAIYQLMNFRALATGLPAGIALGGIPVVAMWLLAPNLELQAANAPPVWLAILYIIGGALVLQGFPEELIYRGWLFSVTEEQPWLSLVWTSVAFGLIHLVSQGCQQGSLEFLLYLICPFGFGLLCGASVLWRQSLWWAVGVHTGLHIANGAFEIWFTEVFDIANWVVLGFICIVLAIVVITRWRQRVSA